MIKKRSLPLAAALTAGLILALTPVGAASAVVMETTDEPTGSDPVDPALTQVVDTNEKVAPKGTEVELTAGHIDMGPRFIDGQWTLMIRDDTDIEPVWRHLDDVVFRVSDAGIMELPDDPQYDFVGADGDVWVVPQTEVHGVIWLGWNTQDPEVTQRVQGAVSLVYGGHEGEGSFNVFVQAGNFGGPQQLWTSANDVSQPISVELNTHTHANWIFTEPGTHLVHMTASAALADGTAVEDTKILRFAVGDAANADDARAAEWALEIEPEEPAAIDEPSAVDEDETIPSYVAIGLGAAVVVVLIVALVARSRSQKRRREVKEAVESESADRS